MLETIKKRISIAIDESEYTLDDLARKLGITASAVYYYKKTGKISADKLFSLAKLLNKPITYFFGIENVQEEVVQLLKDPDNRFIFEQVSDMIKSNRKELISYLISIKIRNILDDKRITDTINEEFIKDIIEHYNIIKN